MIISNISSINFNSYNRLSMEDISRLPKNVPNNSQNVSNVPFINSKKAFNLAKFFTIIGSAAVGLYIAHRNNLFNPVLKEAKRILKTPDTFEKINKYVSENFTADNCSKFTKKFLSNLSADASQTPAFKKQAAIIANNETEFKNLASRIFSKLHDDTNPESLKKGFSIDIMDNWLPEIMQRLQKLKDKRMPYKNLQPEIISDLFKKGSDGTMPIDDLFYKSIIARVNNTIVDTVQDAKTVSEISHLI